MLVCAETTSSEQRRDDAVVAAFLAFLGKEMQRQPHMIAPLNQALTRRIDSLVEGVTASPDEDLGDEVLL
jgi:hypothetical protein